MTETDKALAVAGFVRFRGEKGPIMLRAMVIDMILPIDGGLCRIVVGEGYADVNMAAADAQGRLAEALKEQGA